MGQDGTQFDGSGRLDQTGNDSGRMVQNHQMDKMEESGRMDQIQINNRVVRCFESAMNEIQDELMLAAEASEQGHAFGGWEQLRPPLYS